MEFRPGRGDESIQHLADGSFHRLLVSAGCDLAGVGKQGKVVAYRRRDGPTEFARRRGLVIIGFAQLQVTGWPDTRRGAGGWISSSIASRRRGPSAVKICLTAESGRSLAISSSSSPPLRPAQPSSAATRFQTPPPVRAMDQQQTNSHPPFVSAPASRTPPIRPPAGCWRAGKVGLGTLSTIAQRATTPNRGQPGTRHGATRHLLVAPRTTS